MPIKPENKNRYPENWKSIRMDILKRANNCCEFCGIQNYSLRDSGAKVVLTIAHLNHTPEDCRYENYRQGLVFCTACESEIKCLILLVKKIAGIKAHF